MPNRDGNGPRQQSPNLSRRGGGRRRGNCFQNLDNFNNSTNNNAENIVNETKTDIDNDK